MFRAMVNETDLDVLCRQNYCWFKNGEFTSIKLRFTIREYNMQGDLIDNKPNLNQTSKVFKSKKKI